VSCSQRSTRSHKKLEIASQSAPVAVVEASSLSFNAKEEMLLKMSVERWQSVDHCDEWVFIQQNHTAVHTAYTSFSISEKEDIHSRASS
jgi:hypothetical protein